MKHLILAVFLVVQAPAPVPRQAANNSSQPNHNNQEQPTEPQPGNNPTKPDIPQQASGDHADQHEGKPVHVVVAPVDVNKDPADYALILANLLLTAATLVIAAYAVIQANAAKRSADFDEQTVRMTQRADVLLEDVTIRVNSDEKPIGPDTQLILNFKNFGPTRANNVIFDFGIKVSGNKTPVPGSSYTKPPIIPIVIGAGENGKNVTFNRFGDVFSGETIEKISDGRLPVMVSGKITYTDVFGTSHTVQCGGQYRGDLLAFVADETKTD